MTFIQVAAFSMRLFSVYLFFNAAVLLTTLPTELFNIHTSQVDYIVKEHEFLFAMSLVRFVIYFAGGVCFLAFARPLAKLFTKGLDQI